MDLKFVVPVLFGIEGITAKELKKIGVKNVKATDGKVYFDGSINDMMRVNFLLRTGERVLILLDEFIAYTFEELYQGIKKIPFEDFIPKDGAFPVKGYAIKSSLHSVPDCQKIIKKAIVDRLSQKYSQAWFKETGAKYQIQFSVFNNNVSVMLDTSGNPLSKRGYRLKSVEAPIRETLAAAIVNVSRFGYHEPFIDPMCGSGTFVLEALMTAKNIPSGILRKFAFEDFCFINKKLWKNIKDEEVSKIRKDKYLLFGSDIDPYAVETAKENAKRLGVSEEVLFEVKDIKDTYPIGDKGTVIINPPYGERLLELSQARELYKDISKAFERYENYNFYIITSDDEFESCFGRKADKKRKLYNGMLKCQLYQYFKQRG